MTEDMQVEPTSSVQTLSVSSSLFLLRQIGNLASDLAQDFMVSRMFSTRDSACLLMNTEEVRLCRLAASQAYLLGRYVAWLHSSSDLQGRTYKFVLDIFDPLSCVHRGEHGAVLYCIRYTTRAHRQYYQCSCATPNPNNIVSSGGTSCASPCLSSAISYLTHSRSCCVYIRL